MKITKKLGFVNMKGQEDNNMLGVQLPKLKDRIVHIREKTGLTQREFSKVLGVQTSTYQYWESGNTSPGGKHLEKINFIDIVFRNDLSDAGKFYSIAVEISKEAVDDVRENSPAWMQEKIDAIFLGGFNTEAKNILSENYQVAHSSFPNLEEEHLDYVSGIGLKEVFPNSPKELFDKTELYGGKPDWDELPDDIRRRMEELHKILALEVDDAVSTCEMKIRQARNKLQRALYDCLIDIRNRSDNEM